MRQGVIVGALVASGVLFTLSTAALACGGPPPEPPPTFWIQYHGQDPVNGDHKFWIGQEISLHSPGPAGATCLCGLNLSGPQLPPPGVIQVKDVDIFIVNTLTHEMTRQGAFLFNPSSAAQSGLDQNFPGGQWVGASTAQVGPFNADPLQFPFVYKLLFEVNVPRDTPRIHLHGLVGAGEWDGNGPPPATFATFNPVDNGIWIPAPASFALLGTAGLMAMRRRR